MKRAAARFGQTAMRNNGMKLGKLGLKLFVHK